MEHKLEFELGEMVTMKIDGSVGQIVGDMGTIGSLQLFVVRFPCKDNFSGNLYRNYEVRLFEMEKV